MAENNQSSTKSEQNKIIEAISVNFNNIEKDKEKIRKRNIQESKLNFTER
ncbi:hypothetical protein PBI_SCTP2_390 [Salicola phage SCTP-2]|nr:hypothetical protein PBI_SCTP2_390 [Salicola phage SCTP-2]